MYSRFLYYVLQFQGVMVLTMVSLLAVTLALLVMMRDFSWTSRRRLLVITLFFQMPGRYMVYLAANYIQFMFVLSMVFTLSDVQLSHLIFLILLGILQAASIAQIGESIRSLVGSVMLYVAFLIVDLLKSYIFDLRFDWRIAFVCCLLCVFLVLYSVYFFINSIKCLASRNIRMERVQRKKKIQLPKKPGEEMGLVDLDTEDLTELDFIEEYEEGEVAADEEHI